MRLHTAAVAGMALALIVAACGGGGTGSQGKLALERYFHEFERVESRLNARAEEAAEALEFDAALRLTSEFQKDLEDISPPAEAEALHNELIDALGVYAQVFADSDDLEGDFQSPDFPALDEAFQDSGARIQAACDGLEEVAADRAIEADLGCASPAPPGAKPTSPSR